MGRRHTGFLIVAEDGAIRIRKTHPMTDELHVGEQVVELELDLPVRKVEKRSAAIVATVTVSLNGKRGRRAA
jgi:hypothetical protein